MVFVILCGGLGTRMAQGTFPKPLTPILGSPSIKFALRHLAGGVAADGAPLVRELIIVYASHLSRYSFEETIINLFPRVACTFSCVPFGTRGAVETALAGVLALRLPPTTPLVFLDNDNVYPASLAAFADAPAGAFLGFDFDHTDSAAHSFMRCDGAGAVRAFAEKRRISDQICTGVYGFASAAQFLQWGRHALQHGPFLNNEIYMSSVFVNMIERGEEVRSVPVPIVPLGTALLADSFTRAEGARLRICFDLDGTLVTPPRVPGDLSTVRAVPANVALAARARAEGHTVVIHTARAQADLADVTFASLQALGIPFDEVVFGKPRADVYVDGRAVNPFLQSVRAMGLPLDDAPPADGSAPVPNALPSRVGKPVGVCLRGGRVVKFGPAAALRREAHFYEAAAALLPPTTRELFPCFHGSTAHLPGAGQQQRLELTLDYVKGVPLTSLLCAQLLAPYHLELVLAGLDALHAFPPQAPAPRLATVRGAVRSELEAGLSECAGLSDAAPTVALLVAFLARYAAADGGGAAAPVTHGDCALGNIVLTSTNKPFFLRMQPRCCDGASACDAGCALRGDPLRDYASIALSLLGLEEAAHGLPCVAHAYRLELVAAFVAMLRERGVDTALVLGLGACLAAGAAAREERAAGARALLWLLARELARPSSAELGELVGLFLS